jgi:hypothetical protein
MSMFPSSTLFNYQFRLENELRTTSKTNCKEFWKILKNFLKKNKENDKDISMAVLYNYNSLPKYRMNLYYRRNLQKA